MPPMFYSSVLYAALISAIILDVNFAETQNLTQTEPPEIAAINSPVLNQTVNTTTPLLPTFTNITQSTTTTTRASTSTTETPIIKVNVTTIKPALNEAVTQPVVNITTENITTTTTQATTTTKAAITPLPPTTAKPVVTPPPLTTVKPAIPLAPLTTVTPLPLTAAIPSVIPPPLTTAKPAVTPPSLTAAIPSVTPPPLTAAIPSVTLPPPTPTTGKPGVRPPLLKTVIPAVTPLPSTTTKPAVTPPALTTVKSTLTPPPLMTTSAVTPPPLTTGKAAITLPPVTTAKSAIIPPPLITAKPTPVATVNISATNVTTAHPKTPNVTVTTAKPITTTNGTTPSPITTINATTTTHSPTTTTNGTTTTTPPSLTTTTNGTTTTPTPMTTTNVTTTTSSPITTTNGNLTAPIPITTTNGTTTTPSPFTTTNGTITTPSPITTTKATTVTSPKESTNTTKPTVIPITVTVKPILETVTVNPANTSTTTVPPIKIPKRILPKRIEADKVRLSASEKAHVCSNDLPSIRRIEPPNPKADSKHITHVTEHVLPESFRVGNTTYIPYKVLVSSIGARGNWGPDFKCEAPAYFDEIQYILGNDQVQSLRFQCTNPRNKKTAFLPVEPELPENSTIRLNLKCSHWGLNEIIGIQFVYEEAKGFVNIARFCRGSGNRTWATGISTKGLGRWQKQGLVCPGNSRIWTGRIKSGQIDGIKFITGVMLGCYLPVMDLENYPLIENTSPVNATGNWTEWEFCGNGSFGASVKLHYSDYVKYHNTNITGTANKKMYKYLSEIQLGCLFPGKLNTSNFIGKNNYLEGSSYIGGVWTNEAKCEGLLRTFNLQMRRETVLEKVGNNSESEKEIFDEIAAVGFHGKCSNESWIGHVMQNDDADWVNNTGQCEMGFAICGIRYQYRGNADNGSKIGISSVEMKCCPVHLSQPCNPTEHWISMKTLRNNTGIVSKFQYDTKWENGFEFPTLSNLLEFRFRSHMWDNSESGDAWKIEPYTTFTSKGRTFKQHYKPENGTMTIVYQLIGTCGHHQLEYVRVRSRRLKFVNFEGDGSYMYTDYN